MMVDKGELAQSKPSFKKALLYLIGLGIIFYISYPLSNWWASIQTDVPSIVFGWEKNIPFWQWAIIPYWTINFVYAASLFFCRTKIELDAHAKRLLTAQCIAVAFFVLAPLQFSFDKPITSGFPKVLFDALNAFDKPFNQAPSLHIALTLILMDLGLKILPYRFRGIIFLWSLAVILSVLTTYQHHFIDIPTGILLGVFCIWLWPLDNRHHAFKLYKASKRHLRLGLFYGLGGAFFVALSILFQGAFLWLLWPAASLLCVCLSYFGLGNRIFDKTASGHMNWPSRLILLPYLVVAFLNSRTWTHKNPDAIQITDNIWIGRFPADKDLAGFDTVIDMTCEFHKKDFRGNWVCIPMLDLVAPTVGDLQIAVQSIDRAQSRGRVLVVCALGYGRSVMAVIGYLLKSGKFSSIDDAIHYVRHKKNISLSADQIAIISQV